MRSSDRSDSADGERPILPWRIVAGALLHVALPAYLLIGLLYAAITLLAGAGARDLAVGSLRFSARFALIYLAGAIVSIALAAMLDPSLRRRQRRLVARHPAAAERQSRDRLARSLALGRAALAGQVVAILDTIAALSWDHTDAKYQVVSIDLAEVVRTSTAALATSPPDRRQDLSAITAAALLQIAARLQELQEERSRLDAGDLYTVARYIDSRYPPSDSAGDSKL